MGCAPALAHETGSVEPMSTPKHPDVPTPAGVANVGDWRPMPGIGGRFAEVGAEAAVALRLGLEHRVTGPAVSR